MGCWRVSTLQKLTGTALVQIAQDGRGRCLLHRQGTRRHQPMFRPRWALATLCP